jgi:hypothetical protein
MPVAGLDYEVMTKFTDFYTVVHFPYMGWGVTLINEATFRISSKLYSGEILVPPIALEVVVEGGPPMDFSVGFGAPILTERAHAAVSDLIRDCAVSYPARITPTDEQMYVLSVLRTVPQSLVPSLSRLVYGEQPEDAEIESNLDRDLLPLGPLLRLVKESGTGLICHQSLVDRILANGLIGPGLRQLGTGREIMPGYSERTQSQNEDKEG